jgi:thiamine-monophosphate kinase
MRESDLLDHIYRSTAGMGLRFDQVVVGPGDDAAVVRTPPGDTLLVTVDQLIERRHFDPGTPVDLIARKAVARSISDIAAMGGVPFVGLATGAIPPGFDHERQLVDALHRWAEHWRMPLVGGDVAATTGPLTLTVTAIGRPATDEKGAMLGPYLRSTARPGDDIFVTGVLGGSLASGWHLRFEPRLAEAALIARDLGPHLHALIDISDGLGRDGARVGRASGVVLEIDAARLPMREGVDDWRRAAGDGEDYELLLTASADREVDPAKTTWIGRVVAPSADQPAGAVIVDEAGNRHDGADFGWDHVI